MDLSNNRNRPEVSLLIRLHPPYKLIVSFDRLDDVIAKNLSGCQFVTGSPWGTFADFLIDRNSRLWVGLSFEANDEDKRVALSQAELNRAFQYVDKAHPRHVKYPEINLESAFLEFLWAESDDIQFVPAQSDYVLFGYQNGVSTSPDWIGVDRVDLYIETYHLTCPTTTVSTD